MNLYFKFLFLILKRTFWSKEQSILDECHTHFMVDVFDLDLNFHMNNGRFFSLMDLGRLDLMLKTKSLFKFFRNGYYPIVLSESMNFKKSLNLFTRYTLITKIECWDDKFFYFSQKFFKQEDICASSCVRVCFKKRGRKGIIPSKEIFDFLNITEPVRDFNALAKAQVEMDEILMPRAK